MKYLADIAGDLMIKRPVSKNFKLNGADTQVKGRFALRDLRVKKLLHGLLICNPKVGNRDS